MHQSIIEPITTLRKKKHTALDSLFRYAEILRFGEFHVRFDPATGLRAIIAIHNLKRGPAIGGCRFIHYPSVDSAIEDSLRLAYMMSFKAAITNLAHGGAKAVLIKPKVIRDRRAYLEAYADFVHELGGRYITAMDSGTTLEDMDIISTRTPYVTCTSRSGFAHDPSPHTAHGVRRGIEAAVRFHLNKNSLEGLHVTIQGVGHVGYFLAKELHELGVRLTICDVNPLNVQRCVDAFGVSVVEPDEIYAVKADVFAPCALGATLNRQTVAHLPVSIVAGSANNQLAHHRYGELLRERGILYAPDFVINAGGLIYVAAIYDHADVMIATEQVGNIYGILMEIFMRAQQQGLPTHAVAEHMAREKLY